MTENTDRIENAIIGLRQAIVQNIQPYILAVEMHSNDEDRQQIVAGVMNALIECLGRYLGTLEFQGIRVEGSSIDEAVAASREAHLLRLVEREKQLRDAAGVPSDA